MPKPSTLNLKAWLCPVYSFTNERQIIFSTNCLSLDICINLMKNYNLKNDLFALFSVKDTDWTIKIGPSANTS